MSQLALILVFWGGIGNIHAAVGALLPLPPGEGRGEGHAADNSHPTRDLNSGFPSPQPSPTGRGSQKAPPAAVRRWQDAKFGIFIHFGPWSQTGNGLIWTIPKSESVAQREHYLNLYKTFDPIHFDADEWARTIRRSGARYAVFTTKHHDGFCNFNTALTDDRITSPDCPYHSSKHPDLTRQFVRAMRKQKLMPGLYYSNVDWHHPDGVWHSHAQFDESFPLKHPQQWRRFVDYEQGQVRELLTNYGPIDLFWFDIWWPKSGQADAIPMLRMMRELQPNMLINDRGTDGFADFVTPEQRIPDPPPAGPWETCITISQGNGFWYKGPDAKYKSAPELIRMLAEVVSGGGNLLLSIGPRPDGTLVEQEVQRMNEMGAWLARNGDAIYGTTRSPLPNVPEWGRVTQKGSRLYLIVFDWPKGTLRVPISQHVTSATLLHGAKPISFRQAAGGANVDLNVPPVAPDPVASVIQLDVSDPPR